MGLVNKLKSAGLSNPIILETKTLLNYPRVYFRRASLDRLTGLEPDFLNIEGLEAYLEPWNYIVAVAIPYGLLPKDRKFKAEEISSVSIMAWEWDYHLKVKTLIQEALGPDYPYRLHVDQGPLPERYLAMQMGLAKAGRSQMLIHPNYGTAFHLAFILTNLEGEDGAFNLNGAVINPSEGSLSETFDESDGETDAFELSSFCHDCRQCQLHCPTKALTEESDFDGKLCISAITQKKGLLSDWEMKVMGRQLYGCDLCQLSCPANSPLVKGEDNILPDRESMNRVNPLVILEASQKSFAKEFGQMGFSWRGIGVSKRNAFINLGNFGQTAHLEILEGFREHYESSHNEVLAKTAQWAIQQIKERHHRKGTQHEGLKSIIGNQFKTHS